VSWLPPTITRYSRPFTIVIDDVLASKKRLRSTVEELGRAASRARIPLSDGHSVACSAIDFLEPLSVASRGLSSAHGPVARAPVATIGTRHSPTRRTRERVCSRPAPADEYSVRIGFDNIRRRSCPLFRYHSYIRDSSKHKPGHCDPR
jgi:hypothetical protein